LRRQTALEFEKHVFNFEQDAFIALFADPLDVMNLFLLNQNDLTESLYFFVRIVEPLFLRFRARIE